MATKAELEAKIERYKTTINSGRVTGTTLEGVKQLKKKAEDELAALEEEAQTGERKGEKKAGEDTSVKKSKAAPKSKGKSAGAKPKTTKKKEKPAASAHTVNKASRTVTIEGVEYSIDKCGEALEAWDAKLESNRKSGKKFAKKSSGEVIGDKLVSTGEKVLSSIKKADVEKKPTFYKDKLNRLSKLMTELAELIDTLVGSKDASAEIKDLIKQFQAYIKKNLSK